MSWVISIGTVVVLVSGSAGVALRGGDPGSRMAAAETGGAAPTAQVDPGGDVVADDEVGRERVALVWHRVRFVSRTRSLPATMSRPGLDGREEVATSRYEPQRRCQHFSRP
ncbi:hypothetical protein GCM10020295_76020 [Streptomyces cinereospinus]